MTPPIKPTSFGFERDRYEWGQAGPEGYDGYVVKLPGFVPFSRELLIDVGMVQPTPEEAAERARRKAESDARQARYQEALERFKASLAATDDLVARAVLDLHGKEAGYCTECDDDGCALPWPCETVSVVAKVLGIEVPEW